MNETSCLEAFTHRPRLHPQQPWQRQHFTRFTCSRKHGSMVDSHRRKHPTILYRGFCINVTPAVVNMFMATEERDLICTLEANKYIQSSIIAHILRIETLFLSALDIMNIHPFKKNISSGYSDWIYYLHGKVMFFLDNTLS